MENYKEIVILIFQIIMALVVWYYIFKFLFKGIRAVFRYFFPKQQQIGENAEQQYNEENIPFQTLLSDAEKEKVAQGLSSTKKQSSSVFEKMFIVIFAIIGSIFAFMWKMLKGIYHELTTHCPKCDSEKIEELGSKEIDRYLTSKKVTERLASGKTKTKHVNCTKVKIMDYYRCKECGYQFTETRTKELR